MNRYWPLPLTAAIGLLLAVAAFHLTHIDGKLLMVCYVAYLIGAMMKHRSRRQ